MPLEQTSRSTSASERRSSKRPGSPRPATYGFRSQYEERKSSAPSGSIARASARDALDVCVVRVRVGVVRVDVLIVLVVVAQGLAALRAQRPDLVVVQAGHAAPFARVV